MVLLWEDGARTAHLKRMTAAYCGRFFLRHTSCGRILVGAKRQVFYSSPPQHCVKPFFIKKASVKALAVLLHPPLLVLTPFFSLLLLFRAEVWLFHWRLQQAALLMEPTIKDVLAESGLGLPFLIDLGFLFITRARSSYRA